MSSFVRHFCFPFQISHCYPDVLSSFPNELTQILQQNATTMNPQLRFTMCRALMLLRSKGLIEPGGFLAVWFVFFLGGGGQRGKLTTFLSWVAINTKFLFASGVILELFFKLFRCQDKELRKALYSHVINDIKSMNAKRKNNSVNTQLQVCCFLSHGVKNNRSFGFNYHVSMSNRFRKVDKVKSTNSALSFRAWYCNLFLPRNC